MAAEIREAAGQSVTKPATAMSAVEGFDALLGRLENCISKASGCGDRIVGARPSPVEGKSDQVTPLHLILQIQERRNRLGRAVDHLEAELIRIESGLS